MTRAWQAPLLPIYIGACLVLGGSTEGVWTNLVLQIGALGLLAVSLAARPVDRLPRRARQLVGLASAMILLVVIQLVPLPPSLWVELPGREFVVSSLRLIGEPLPWMPLSLNPAETMTSACFLLPPLAVMVWIVRGGPLSLRSTVLVVLAVGLAGAVLGLRQISTGNLSLYFYRFASWGKAPGFFANSSHMAALMLVSVPFLAALVIDIGDRDSGRRAGVAIGAPVLFAILMAVVAINASGAVLLLSAPVLFLTVALWGGRGVAWLRRLAVPLLIAALAGTIALNFLSGRTSEANNTSLATRSVIWSHSREALSDFGLAGSGVGSFVEIYQRFEPAETIEMTSVNHAHNDYLELALETGLPGVILIVLFLWWWASAAWSAWRGANENVYARAASIASGALLLHEMVEYPLRSPALTSLFALCVGLMAMVAVLPIKRRDGEIWGSRHLFID